MNPFEEINEIYTKEHIINIWVEHFGRNKITYVSGWDINDKELTEHVKHIKKYAGCNGTIKNNVIQLQGNHVMYLKTYLNKQNINSDNIKIKGY